MTETRALAGRKEWIGLAVLVLPCLLIAMDMSVLYFALPFLSADLAPSGTQQLWIMDIYGFVLAGLLITMGSLGDRIGRRRLLLFGAAAFGVASVAAAYSTSAGMLIATRAILGLAGATLMPSTLALIRNMFHDPQQRRTAIAVWTGGLTGGVSVGPIVGGFLLDHFWWGSAFLINTPAMLALLVLGPMLLPEFRDPRPGRFDLVSVVLSLGAVLPVIYGVKRLAVGGVAPVAVVSVAAGLVLGVAFVRRQRRLTDPMIDLRLFRNRAFSGSIVTNVVTSFTMIGCSLFTTQYLQLVLGMRPLEAALWSLAAMPPIFVAVTLATVLARTVRPAHIIGGGLATAALGLLVLTQVRVDSHLAVVLVGAGVLAGGMVTAATLTADLIVAAAPPERAGAASALSETGSELGGALGIALLGSIGAAVYHHQMAGTDPAARETLGAAAEVAAHLPAPAGTALLHAGREAFTQGMNTTAIAGAIVIAATAVIVTAMLHRVRPTAPAEAEQPIADAVPAGV